MRMTKVLVVALLAASAASARAADAGRADAFDYPVKPGTSEWTSFKTHAEMVRACQIPTASLKSLPTDALIQACMDYPLFPDIFAFNNLQEGFERVSSRFNGMGEVLDRGDSGEKLLQRFKGMDPGIAEGKTFRFEFIQMMLAQDAVLASLSPGDRVAVLKESCGKFRAKQKHPGRFGGVSQAADLFLMARAMDAMGAPSFRREKARDARLGEFCRRSAPLDRSVAGKVLAHAEKLISETR